MKGEDPARATATDYVGNFLFKFRVFSAFAERMRVDGEPFDSTSPSIKAALEPKSTETVRKRAGSLRMFVGWFANSAFFKGCPFDEITVFNYLGYLNSERVPATRGSTFRETVHWMGALFGFEVEATQKSSRVRGLSIRLLKTRGVLKQRDPLTVAMVTTLEEIATDADGFQDDFDIVIAGAALFVLYSRARVGDVARAQPSPPWIWRQTAARVTSKEPCSITRPPNLARDAAYRWPPLRSALLEETGQRRGWTPEESRGSTRAVELCCRPRR